MRNLDNVLKKEEKFVAHTRTYKSNQYGLALARCLAEVTVLNTMEGYVLHAYGNEQYLRHAVASVCTLRRHDTLRPVALYTHEQHIAVLKEHGLDRLFQVLEVLPADYRSIVGFKHNLMLFKPFERSLFVDSDMVWCRNPDALWQRLQGHPFTITGLDKADAWFGGPKGPAIFIDRLLDRRRRTMKRFGLTYLPRVQAGIIYAADDATTQAVSENASAFLSRRKETHFRSRMKEGRRQESCEWSLAMAMSALDLPVVPWFQGQDSPQMDYVEGYVEHDPDFEHVRCRYYTDAFIHGLRGFPNQRLRDSAVSFFGRFPGRGDYVWVTPYALHFGWKHHKSPFYDLSDRCWDELTASDIDAVNSSSSQQSVPARALVSE